MNISSLTSLGLQAQPQKAAGPKSAKETSSFEDVLGKTADSKKPEAGGQKSEAAKQSPRQVQKQNQNQKQSEFKKFEAPQQSERQASERKSDMGEPKRDGDKQAKAENTEVDAESLPVQPTPPTLNTPISDKVLAPVTGPMDSMPVSTVGTKNTAVAQDEGVDSLTRRVVWNDFLRKMKDDLGVSAEDILQAFASLSDEELAQPPQQTADKIVMALGLTGQQAQLGKQYFQELVKKTQSRSLGEELETSQKQISLTLMTQREMQRKALQRSLDQMNQNFFMKNPPVKPAAQVQDQQQSAAAAAPMAAPFMDAGAQMETQVPAEMAGAGMTMPMTEAPQAPTAAKRPSEVMDELTAQPQQAVKKDEKATIDELVRQFMMPQAKPETMKAAEVAQSAAPETAAKNAAPVAAAGGMVSAAALKGLLNDLGAKADGDEDSEYTSDASYLGTPMSATDGLNSLSGANGDFKSQMAQQLAPNQPVAVPELVDRAQIMVREGGGEMKVTLSPDGLGEVAMRVSVNDGKVQVQMITESDEAKHMIERQLSELKTQLSSNHLHVDSIKIDTASNIGKQMEQQYQDAQRQLAQQTLEQFRQDHQGWRRSFFELPSAKQYKGQSEAPRDVQAPSASSRKNNSRRLDLVA